MKPRRAPNQGQEVRRPVRVDIGWIRRAILHPDVSIHDDFRLRLVRLDARVDEQPYREIDLNEYWLPANTVFTAPQPMTNRPELVAVMVLAVDKYFQRARRSKSRHSRAGFIVAVLAKLFEYMWIRDQFALWSVTREDFAELSVALAQEGWHGALQVERRLDAALAAGGHLLAERLLASKHSDWRFIVPAAVKQCLGVNIIGRELARYHHRILASCRGSARRRSAASSSPKGSALSGMGFSLLRQTFEAVNLAFDLPGGIGFSCLPYPDAFRTAKRLGHPQSRTKNLGAAEAGLLLGEAFRWLYVYGPLVHLLVSGVCQQVTEAHRSGREVLGDRLEEWLLYSDDRRRLEEALGTKISGLDIASSDGISVREALMSVLTASFILIAVLNARRRDEVLHRKFGIHRGFTEVEDETLRLYRANFYIEKTYQDYLPFYVNQATRDAALLLESIQQSFDIVNRQLGRRAHGEFPVREQSLFGYHRFSRVEGVNKTRCWFSFESRPGGQAYYFLTRALGEQFSLGVHPHMFRRLYALVYMYQHEEPSLQALSQQLAHNSLSTTMVYVTDPVMRNEQERIAAQFGGSRHGSQRAFSFHLSAISKELNIVRDEKLVETVLAIISGQRASGGYPAYIRRFYRIVSRHADFSSLDMERRAQFMSKVLTKRGHVVNPSRHGQCMSGAQMRAPGARCHGTQGETRPHKATALLCGRCPFQYVNAAYLRNLEVDLAALNRIAADPELTAFERQRARIDAENLRSAILHHRKRLELETAK